MKEVNDMNKNSNTLKKLQIPKSILLITMIALTLFSQTGFAITRLGDLKRSPDPVDDDVVLIQKLTDTGRTEFLTCSISDLGILEEDGMAEKLKDRSSRLTYFSLLFETEGTDLCTNPFGEAVSFNLESFILHPSLRRVSSLLIIGSEAGLVVGAIGIKATLKTSKAVNHLLAIELGIAIPGIAAYTSGVEEINGFYGLKKAWVAERIQNNKLENSEMVIMRFSNPEKLNDFLDAMTDILNTTMTTSI